MISAHEHQPQAIYDNDGNIVIGLNTHSALPVKEKMNSTVDDISPLIPLISAEPSAQEEITWETLEEETPAQQTVREERLEVRARFADVSATFLQVKEETAAQMKHTVSQTTNLAHEASASLKKGATSLWAFLQTPMGTHRDRSPALTFIVDVVRFGGTFAAIFFVLFSALNAQSFWEIAKATVLPLLEPPSLNVEELRAPIPANHTASARQMGLMAYLPEVGPPTDMVIIPKLKVAAPIVQPPTEALLRQDWAQVEKDIQESLVHGIVHYPGTARPGQAGNFFLTGHSSNYAWVQSAYNSIFARLHQLQEGDEYWVYWNGDKHRYVVRSKKEVSPSDVSVLDQPGDERMSTLMTCTPVGTTLRRLIVQSQEVDPETREPMKVGEHTERAPSTVAGQMLPI